jgi:hypothetical protein
MIESALTTKEKSGWGLRVAPLIKEALGRHFDWYVFDICEEGHVCLIKSGENKFFWLNNYVWRHITNRGQFTRDESLFEKVGLIPEIVSDLATRIKKHTGSFRLPSGPQIAMLHELKAPEVTVRRGKDGLEVVLTKSHSGTTPFVSMFVPKSARQKLPK